MGNINTKICLLCQKELKKEIFSGSRDEYRVDCDCCGKYAISREFYDDNLEKDTDGTIKKSICAFVKTKQNDKYITCISNTTIGVCDGVQFIPYHRLNGYSKE